MLKQNKQFTLLKRVSRQTMKGKPIPGTLEDELDNQKDSFLTINPQFISPKLTQESKPSVSSPQSRTI